LVRNRKKIAHPQAIRDTANMDVVLLSKKPINYNIFEIYIRDYIYIYTFTGILSKSYFNFIANSYRLKDISFCI